jgi:hypothetical protein
LLSLLEELALELEDAWVVLLELSLAVFSFLLPQAPNIRVEASTVAAINLIEVLFFILHSFVTFLKFLEMFL